VSIAIQSTLINMANVDVAITEGSVLVNATILSTSTALVSVVLAESILVLKSTVVANLRAMPDIASIADGTISVSDVAVVEVVVALVTYKAPELDLSVKATNEKSPLGWSTGLGLLLTVGVLFTFFFGVLVGSVITYIYSLRHANVTQTCGHQEVEQGARDFQQVYILKEQLSMAADEEQPYIAKEQLSIAADADVDPSRSHAVPVILEQLSTAADADVDPSRSHAVPVILEQLSTAADANVDPSRSHAVPVILDNVWPQLSLVELGSAEEHLIPSQFLKPGRRNVVEGRVSEGQLLLPHFPEPSPPWTSLDRTKPALPSSMMFGRATAQARVSNRQVEQMR